MSEQKHTGEIGKKRSRYEVHYAKPGSGILIESTGNGMDFFLFPSEALSLLAWLEQERTNLERLTKEER